MLGEVIGQMRRARQHVVQARAMIAQALTELKQADALIRVSLQGSSDQSPAAMAEKALQQVTEATQSATATTMAIDQTLARWGATGSPGN